jgi:hypothetical protein
LAIGLTGGLLALVMIVAAMRYLGSGKPTSSDRRSAATASVAFGPVPALVLDEAMRAVQRGQLDRAIDVLKAERSREPNPAIDSLIDSLKRLRSSR